MTWAVGPGGPFLGFQAMVAEIYRMCDYEGRRVLHPWEPTQPRRRCEVYSFPAARTGLSATYDERLQIWLVDAKVWAAHVMEPRA